MFQIHHVTDRRSTSNLKPLSSTQHGGRIVELDHRPHKGKLLPYLCEIKKMRFLFCFGFFPRATRGL